MDSQEFHSPSEADSKSQMSLSYTSPDHARVLVQLSNGIKVLVPIRQDSTVKDLHEKALKRAPKFGVTTTIEKTYLQTSGRTAVALCEDDLLGDVWDLTEDATFILRDLEQQISLDTPDVTTSSTPVVNKPSTNISTDKTQSASATLPVYIRLLTLEQTMSNTTFYSSSEDTLLLQDSASLSQLAIAVEVFYKGKKQPNGAAGGGSQPKDPKINLYLRQCRLHTEGNMRTLRDLNIDGNKETPLSIFVDFDYSDQSPVPLIPTKDECLGDLWGFQTTRRGICTFVTSLEILIQRTKSQDRAVDNLLSLLLETTHYPPLAIVFKTLCASHVNYKPDFAGMRMLAWAVHLLCLQTAPAWVCETPEQALESSRQVLSWLCSLRPDAAHDVDDKKASLLKCFEIRKSDDKQVETWYEDQEVVFNVELSTMTTAISGGSETVVVNLSKDDKDLATFLAYATADSFTSSTGYYFEETTDWKSMFRHEKVFPPQPSDFSLLLHSTAESTKLRSISPDKLAKCVSRELPVITLSAGGYISTYDQEDYACGVLQYFTWNATEGKEVMTSENPGQYLMQKLSGTMVERKKTGAWVADAWSDWSPKTEFGKPDEAVVVCMDTSLSMEASMPASWLGSGPRPAYEILPSRLTEVKEFFKNLASRVSALQLSTYLGLVTFSSRDQIAIRQDLTPVHLDFEDQMDEIKPQNQTAIYDGIERARKMLSEIKKQHKDVKCRIVVLTDGQDNQSVFLPSKIAKQMYTDGVVVDSLVIGTGTLHSKDLFRISRTTGGYAFAPSDQRTFFQIFLLETMVDMRTRPNIDRVFVAEGQWITFAPKADDMADPYNFPPSRPHPNQGDCFIALKDAERFLSRQHKYLTGRAPSVVSSTTQSISTTLTGTTVASSTGTSRFFLSEIKEMINNPHPYMDVYISESDMGFWLVAMQGPPDSPYSQGTFKLYLELGPEFPLRPPSARFITPMLHPNITKHGRICHPILDREWTGTTRVYQVLQHIWGILVSIEARGAIDPLSALKLWTDPAQGRLEVEKYVKHFATKSRAAIQLELYYNETSVVSSAASVRSEFTVANTKKFATPTSSVISSARPSYQSQTPTSNQGPGLLRNLLALRSNRPVNASPPPLMVMPGHTPTSGDRKRSTDDRSQTSSVNSTSTRGDRRRRSLFAALSKHGSR